MVRDHFYMRKDKAQPKWEHKEEDKVGKVTEVSVNPNGVMARTTIENKPYEQAKKYYNLISQDNIKDPEPDGEPDGEPEDEDCEEDDEEARDAAGMTESEHLALRQIDRSQPYVIDHTSFADEYPNHDKISLYYYRDDDVLCEELNEEPLDDIEGSVGYDALGVLDMQTTVWVRNERLGIDYEIISVRGSFAENVLGMRRESIMTPRERYIMEKQKRDRNGRDE